LIEKTLAWTVANERLTAMELEWQALESELFQKASSLGMDCRAALRGELLEARAMRALDHRIRTAYRALDRVSGEIALMRATSISGALAKIELGMRVQGPCDWKRSVIELIESGLAELRTLASRA
jgi:hypothetical protein